MLSVFVTRTPFTLHLIITNTMVIVTFKRLFNLKSKQHIFPVFRRIRSNTIFTQWGGFVPTEAQTSASWPFPYLTDRAQMNFANKSVAVLSHVTAHAATERVCCALP